jgi:hypothetical protein
MSQAPGSTHRFAEGVCTKCGCSQYNAERHGWPCGNGRPNAPAPVAWSPPVSRPATSTPVRRAAAPASVNGGTTAPHDADVLVASAHPDVYRFNAFRILGIGVDATPRDLAQRKDKLRIMEKLNMKDGAGGALPLVPPPGADATRAALQRLHDPVRRLVDELFWFWPHELGRSAGDAALLALGRQDVQVALDTWLRQESYQSESNVSVHNLAVLFHTQALDLEGAAATRDLTADERKKRDQCWRETGRRWKRLLGQEGFWSRLSARIRDLQDPRLTTGTSRRFRESLPLALLSISAHLAVEAAERGAYEDAKRHTQIMREWGFEATAVEEALRRATQPLRRRIMDLCQHAREQGKDDARHANVAACNLLEQTAPMLKALDCVLPEGHATREAAHDEVALGAFSPVIDYGNETEDWVETRRLLDLVRAAAASASTRNRIDQNIATVDGNVAIGRCHFCEQGQADDACPIEIAMHGDVQKFPIPGGTRTTWRHMKVKVPRCAQCRQVHKRRDTVMTTFVILGGLAGVPFYGIGAVPGLILGGVVGWLISTLTTPKHVKSADTAKQHASVKDNLADGWGFGEKPPGVS